MSEYWSTFLTSVISFDFQEKLKMNDIIDLVLNEDIRRSSEETSFVLAAHVGSRGSRHSGKWERQI